MNMQPATLINSSDREVPGYADRDAYEAGDTYVDMQWDDTSRPGKVHRAKLARFTPAPLPAVGDTIYARWVVGPAQRGSGWIDPSDAAELDAWVVNGGIPALDFLTVQVPGGGSITIRPGQYELTARG